MPRIPLLLLSLLTSPVLAQLPPLHTQATQILDSSNRPILLRGINLGGWFVEEMWMMPFVTTPPQGSPFPPVTDHVTLWSTIEKRLGHDAAHRIRTAFRTAWITEADFDRIRDTGFNCVRLPFLYDLLDEPNGQAWIDKALAWARARNLYVILDLHGAPGRQSNDHHSGQQGVNRLFRNPAMVQQTIAVWKRLASLYRDHPEVAGYDLLNEPMGAPNHSTLYMVQDQLYRAIRQIDPRHLIFIEDGYRGVSGMPDPAVVGWQNVVYSIHRYDFAAKSPDEHLKSITRLAEEIATFTKDHPVPFYIGEFGIEPQATPDTMKSYLQILEKNKLSWSPWTYKTAFTTGSHTRTTWAQIRNPGPVKPLNPFQDSEQEMLEKIPQLASPKMSEYTSLTDAFKSATSKK